MYSNNPERHIKDLEYQLERERDIRQAEQDWRERERREKLERLKADAQERILFAESWPDAFNKGLPRFRHEAAEERRDNEYNSHLPEAERSNSESLHWFTDLVPKLEAAQNIYFAEMETVQRKIIDLEAQIQQVRQDALNRAADRVHAEVDEPGIEEAFRNNDPNYLTNW